MAQRITTFILLSILIHSKAYSKTSCEAPLMASFSANTVSRQELEVQLGALATHVMKYSSDPDVLFLLRGIVQHGFQAVRDLENLGSTAQELRNGFLRLAAAPDLAWTEGYLQNIFEKSLQGQRQIKSQTESLMEVTAQNGSLIIFVRNKTNWLSDSIAEGTEVRGEKIKGPNGNVYLKDYVSGLLWSPVHSQYMTWREAMAYCEKKTDFGLQWRLPSSQEFWKAFNSENSEHTNTALVNLFGSNQPNLFSSTPDRSPIGSTIPWVKHFSSSLGHIGCMPISPMNTGYFRCVGQ